MIVALFFLFFRSFNMHIFVRKFKRTLGEKAKRKKKNDGKCIRKIVYKQGMRRRREEVKRKT